MIIGEGTRELGELIDFRLVCVKHRSISSIGTGWWQRFFYRVTNLELEVVVLQITTFLLAYQKIVVL